MDYTEIRDLSISFGELSYDNMNKEYIFYYDETNNPRLFKLTDNGFNFDDKAYFILGGLVFHKDKLPLEESIINLYSNLQVQSSMKEIKFKHIQQKAKTFLDLLSKTRVQNFIEWLFKNEYWVHYSYRDNFYYSIVDIIDSMDESAYGGPDFNRGLKSKFYETVKADKQRFLALLRKYKYPNIVEQKAFVENVLEWIEEMNKEEDFLLEYLRQALKSYRKKTLAFLKNNEEAITIENYSDIYQNEIFLFAYAKHIFDEEDVIERKIESNEIKLSGKIVDNYQFVKSEKYELVQLSDLTVGILRMWMAYLEGKSIIELVKEFNELNDNERKTIIQFQSILNKSLEENIAFKHGSGSNDFERKITFFLEYKFDN